MKEGNRNRKHPQKAPLPKLLEVRLKDIDLHPAYRTDFLKNLVLYQPNRIRLSSDAVTFLAHQVRLTVVTRVEGDQTKFILVSGVRDFQLLRATSRIEKCLVSVHKDIDRTMQERWVQYDCFISLILDQLDTPSIHFVANFILGDSELLKSLDSMLPLKGNNNLASAFGISTNSLLNHKKDKKPK